MNTLNKLSPLFNLTDNNNYSLISSTKEHLLNSGKLKDREQLSIPLNSFSNLQVVKAEIKLNGLISKAGIFASLGHIFDYSNLLSADSSSSKLLTGRTNTSEFYVQNYPNPFNPTTTINYSLPKESDVEIRIYDILGKEIKSVIIGSQATGNHNIIWNGTNNYNEQVSSGIYIYRFKAQSLTDGNIFEKSSKLMMIK